MGLTSTSLLAVVAVLAIAAPIVGVVLWHRSVRLRRVSAGRTVGRWLFVVVGQLMAVALTFLVVNNTFSFYTSWSDLLESSTNSTKIKSQGH